MQKAFVYIDGFNFYRGLHSVGWKDCYWLDLFKFSNTLIKKYDDIEIEFVHYFTARPKDYAKRLRQNVWLDANKNMYPERVEVHYGKYKAEFISCPRHFSKYKDKCPNCNGQFEIQREKQTDVAISVEIMHDAIKKNCDVTVLISGDNDLIPPLNYIKRFHKEHKIIIFYPPNRNKSELHKYSQFKPTHLFYSKEVFLKSKLPNIHGFEDGSYFKKPDEWP